MHNGSEQNCSKLRHTGCDIYIYDVRLFKYLYSATYIYAVRRLMVNLLLDPKDAETMILSYIRCYWPVTQCNIPEDLNLQ